MADNHNRDRLTSVWLVDGAYIPKVFHSAGSVCLPRTSRGNVSMEKLTCRPVADLAGIV